MKPHQSTLTSLLIAVIIVGCSTQYPFLIKRYELNVVSTSTIGAPMFQWGSGLRDVPNNAGKERGKFLFRSVDELQHAHGTLRELIYKGVLDSIASFVYREYIITPEVRFVSGFIVDAGTGTYMKPSYNLEIQYDLKKTKVIAFQDFQLSLQRCDQQAIAFEILSEPEDMHKPPRWNVQ